MRIDTLDDFTVELEHQPQHAVRGRVLGTKIDREIANFGFGHYCFAFSSPGST
jgi:hypothetical protein